MLEFLVRTQELKKAIRLMLSGRKEYLSHDTADFRAVADTLELSSTGSSTAIEATVTQAGYARVPFDVLNNLRRAAVSYTKTRVRLRIEPGRLRIESFGLSHPDIELRRIGGRMADLPVNATPLDALALVKLLSSGEIAEAGLSARVLDAQERAISAIEWATDSLKEFRVPREAISDLLESHLALYAASIKAAILGTPQSGPDAESPSRTK
ncbi:MAG: hypothetical protein ABSD13_05615 [Candidatus Korobacteraceae bacterium]|jgi:hypothetical protein